MHQSIRDMSRFVIGVTILRTKAIEASREANITFDTVAQATLRNNDEANQLKQSIEILADQESSWLRNTPPHTLKTPRVLQSRDAEIHTFKTTYAAVLALLEYGEQAQAGNEQAKKTIREKLIEAIQAIDQSPGSIQHRKILFSSLQEQAIQATQNATFSSQEIRQAEKEYNERYISERLAPYVAIAAGRNTRYDNDFGM